MSDDLLLYALVPIHNHAKHSQKSSFSLENSRRTLIDRSSCPLMMCSIKWQFRIIKTNLLLLLLYLNRPLIKTKTNLDTILAWAKFSPTKFTVAIGWQREYLVTAAKLSRNALKSLSSLQDPSKQRPISHLVFYFLAKE